MQKAVLANWAFLLPSHTLDELEALFQQLTNELPPGVALLHIRDVPRGGKIIELTPANAAAAPIAICADESQVRSFSFGLKSYWEFPYERRYKYDEKDVMTEIGEMCRAVISGNCEESRGLLSIKGRIFAGDYTYEITTLPVLSGPLFGTRRYAPYA